MTEDEFLAIWREKVRTPAEMRRFMDDPASDPELARDIAGSARLLLKLLFPSEGCNSNPPKMGSEVQHIDGTEWGACACF